MIVSKYSTLYSRSRASTLDGKLSFTFYKIQAYSITKGIFYPSFFIMKLIDKTTEYCQCDFEAKYLDNMDFILS